TRGSPARTAPSRSSWPASGWSPAATCIRRPHHRTEGAGMTDTERSRAVVRDYITALQRGDVDGLRARFTDDATWWLSGDLPVSGTWTGPGEILDSFLAAMLARLDPGRPVTQDLKGLVADGDTVVAE